MKDGLDLIGDYSVLLHGHLMILQANLVKADAGEHQWTSQDWMWIFLINIWLWMVYTVIIVANKFWEK